MNVEIKSFSGTVIRRSRNLRAVMAHARSMRVGQHVLLQNDRQLIVSFSDGAVCRTEFADASVLTQWIKDRVRYGRGKFITETDMATNKNPLNDDNYDGNDEQIDDLKELCGTLVGALEVTNATLENVLLHQGKHMTSADRKSREETVAANNALVRKLRRL